MKSFKCSLRIFQSQTRNIRHVIEYFLHDLYKNSKIYIKNSKYILCIYFQYFIGSFKKKFLECSIRFRRNGWCTVETNASNYYSLK